MKRINNIFEQVVSFDNIFLAWEKAWRGANRTRVNCTFNFNLEKQLLKLRDELRSGTYQPRGYRYFTVHEPKERLIAEAPLLDRVVHHAVVNVLEPIYERSFIYDS